MRISDWSSDVCSSDLIVRTTKRLERALHRVNLLAQEVDEYYGNFRVTPDLIELRNLLEVARLIVRPALRRKESRGLHYVLAYPDMLPRSEEHTSELQSLMRISYTDFCLKKKTDYTIISHKPD